MTNVCENQFSLSLISSPEELEAATVFAGNIFSSVPCWESAAQITAEEYSFHIRELLKNLIGLSVIAKNTNSDIVGAMLVNVSTICLRLLYK